MWCLVMILVYNAYDIKSVLCRSVVKQRYPVNDICFGEESDDQARGSRVRNDDD